jgi:excisionase family DNA binding protein
MHATKSSRHQENQTASAIGLTINDAALRAGVGRSTIYAALNSGALRGKMARKRTLILEVDLRSWLFNLPTFVGRRS